MRFEHRDLLWYALLLLPLTAFFWWSWRKRRQLIAQFVQSRLLAHLTVGVSARRQKLRMGLLVVACGLLIVVLARPQWGFSYEEARQRGLDVVVAIDTSRSMLAADVTPNRLARAKLAALDLKRLARTDRVGLVAFAGSAFLQCPLSFDDEAFRQSVNALDVNIIPQGGSALAEAIEAARTAFERKGDNHKVLVLFTDGEDNAGEAVEVAKKAAEEGLRIFTVGVGTPNGELLRISDGKGRTDYIRDEQGNVVKSRLNEKLLREIAERSNGFYMLLAGANTMELLYERGLAPLPKATLAGRHMKKYHERYQSFLGLVIVLLLVEMFLPERKRVRRADMAPQVGRGVPAEPSSASERLSGTLRPTISILLLTFGIAAEASPARGLKQYQAGHYESALREYRNALRDKKDDPRLHFNAGTAAYQAQNYEKAAEYLNSALITPDLELQQRAYYNRGNALYRLGEATSEPQEKIQQWEDAVSSYESALKLNPNDADAKFNQELVKEKLEEFKKQQEQQQQQQQSKDDQKKDDKDKQDQKKQDPKQEQSKPDESKQQQEKDQQQQRQQQQQQQDQAKKEEQKKEQAKQSQTQKGDKDQQQPQGEGQPMRAMPMTEQQAMQLLDMHKGEERAMIFLPQLRTNRTDRVLKDW
jgi:Ca-activated chloride channel family protein